MMDHPLRIRFFIVAICLAAITVWGARKPETFDLPDAPQMTWQERLTRTPVHLDDDVMIVLRAGYMIEQLGYPGYNRSDKAQPSTSYIAPYVYFLLWKTLPGYWSVWGYVALSLMSAAGALAVIACASRQTWSGCLLAALLAMTQTHFNFVLSAWDHVFQAFFMTCATAMALQKKSDGKSAVMACLLAALGLLYRPDGLPVFLSIIGIVFLRAKRGKQIIAGVFMSLALLAVVLFFNYMQFGHITPTTARLKIGASPSLAYSLEYAASNGWMAYTTLSLCLLLGFAFALSWKRTEGAERMLLGGCVVTVMVALINSDVFIAGRMFWMPACVMALILGRIVDWRISGKWMKWMMVALCVACLLHAWSSAKKNESDIYSFVMPQHDLIHWIKGNLRHSDGVIGLYWLGMAYYIPDFDVSDFLGKADEMIASQSVKWGPPGHNKWDADATIAKWHPQFIIPALPVSWEKDDARIRQEAMKGMALRQGWGFMHDLVLSRQLMNEYAHCRIKSGGNGRESWDFYIRNDIHARHRAELDCKPRS